MPSNLARRVYRRYRPIAEQLDTYLTLEKQAVQIALERGEVWAPCYNARKIPYRKFSATLLWSLVHRGILKPDRRKHGRFMPCALSSSNPLTRAISGEIYNTRETVCGTPC